MNNPNTPKDDLILASMRYQLAYATDLAIERGGHHTEGIQGEFVATGLDLDALKQDSSPDDSLTATKDASERLKGWLDLIGGING